MAISDANILIVEDSPTLALTYREFMRPLGIPIHMAETGAQALDLIDKHAPTVILLDLKLPDMGGIDILKQLKPSGSDACAIVITAHGSVAVAVEAMQAGATDFLLKPFSAERITTTVKNALELHRLSKAVKQFEGNHAKTFDRFIGESPVMQTVYRMIEDCAPSKASVFIMGPSGTGKELCAEAIHQLGPRGVSNFIALNCAAIPENLIESEVFGHKKGAFTGATADRDGAAVSANNGTLFLDEICEMPLGLQAKLLRFIQTGQVVPVGSNTPVKVNVRFICATNRIPWDEVQAGRLREDLYYRLHVIPIHLPPLRERDNDVISIARHLLRSYSQEENKDFLQIEAEAEAELLAHNWPGNVRELGNVIQSAVVLNSGPTLTKEMLSPMMDNQEKPRLHLYEPSQAAYQAMPGIQAPVTHSGSNTELEIEPLEVSERRIMERAIVLSGGKVRQAARKLAINPSTLYRKIKEWSDADKVS
ncbi:MAG: sigma-54-dependent Fis family transcriptional regulator [Kordiimonadales bacterium]|nr:MAG: sigma-54-dependent Fis family transcriptional regulator [Kordiimonadales bacterium]